MEFKIGDKVVNKTTGGSPYMMYNHEYTVVCIVDRYLEVSDSVRTHKIWNHQVELAKQEPVVAEETELLYNPKAVKEIKKIKVKALDKLQKLLEQYPDDVDMHGAVEFAANVEKILTKANKKIKALQDGEETL